MSLLQDYHNLHATAYNFRVYELETQTAHLAESRSKFLSSFLRGGVLAHPRAVVPEVQADCRAVGPNLLSCLFPLSTTSFPRGRASAPAG